MSKVFVLDTNKQPLTPIHPGGARKLLSGGKAAVFRQYPFTIILKKVVETPSIHPLRLKIDPGSKTTGMAIVNDDTGEVVFAAELSHRGQNIKKALDDRRSIRRSRRQRKTRYRPARFLYRGNARKKGRMAPSLMSRVHNTITWAKRIHRYCPLAAISVETVKFDTQAMDNPEIAGTQYQQGTLAGYEVREYLLEKWRRKCAYCGKENVPLQIEHIHPRSKGGTDRVSNLTISCEKCNLAKGTKDIKDFLKNKPDVLKRILAQARNTLKDASAVNTVRWELYRGLQVLGLPLESGTGGRTKFNRVTRNLDKAHWIDAACVGASTPACLIHDHVHPLLIQAKGSGSRQMCATDRYGFPRQHKTRHKCHFGFQTGDIVHASIPKGKYAGTYIGRVAVRASGNFNLTTSFGMISCHQKYCTMVHRNDGYQYSYI